MAIQREGLERLTSFLGPTTSGSSSKEEVDAEDPTSSPQATITFSNPAAKKFFVDGKTIPDGICSFSLSISSLANESVQLISTLVHPGLV